MKSVRNYLIVFSSVVIFSGCYTELATVERNDRGYAYDSDTTYEEGSTAINNNYYLDDDYRRSRLRVSFHYYYPENTSWIGGYYNSYFNDPYWGMRPFSWTYDPWYGYYPTWGCPPYYDPWHPYYPPVVYYPGYYPSPVYGNNTPSIPIKGHRADGPSREGTTITDRSSPIPNPSSTTTVATTPRTRESVPIDKVTPVTRPGKTRDETPWWERKNNEQTKESRPVDRPRIGRTPNAPEKQSRGNEEATSVDRPRETKRPSPKSSVPNNESRPVDRPRETRRPAYSPSPKPSAPSNDARPVERPRESRRESYNPPSQQSAPAPSRGSGSSGSSSSSGGRKRD
jgi:hypothetical protein